MEITEAAVEPKTYFSRSGALTFWTGSPKRFLGEDGFSRVDDGKIVQFQIQPDGYGRFVTDDPERIEACEKRIREQGDIFDTAEYFKRVTPAEQQVVAKDRVIESQNALIQDLQRRLNAKEKASSQK